MASSRTERLSPHYLLHCNETRRNLARKRLVKVSLPRAVTQPEVRCSSRSRCCRDRWRALSPRTPDRALRGSTACRCGSPIFDSYSSRRRVAPLLSMPSARSCHRHLLPRHSWGRHHPVQVGRNRRRRPQMPRRQERTAPNLSGRLDRLNANTVCSGRSYASAGSVAALRRKTKTS